MNSVRLDSVLRHLRHFLDAERAGCTADGDLLDRFTHGHDEAAFAALVQRYGPLVLGVCRRVLCREQDAEDAFQATFLILVRKVGSLRRHGSLAAWLYTVAYRAALKARTGAARRRTEPVALDDLPAPASPDDLARRELSTVLDEELQGLPSKYREPLLLCDLQGRTHAEVARVLGRPVGSMSRLLERARSLLRDRLTRRGLVLSTGVLGMLLAENARAVTPPLLAQTTLRTAAGSVPAPVLAIMEGVLKQMLVTKMKIAGALLLTLSLLGAGAGLLSAQGGPKAPPAPAAEAALAKEAVAETPEDPSESPLPTGALIRLGTGRFRHAFTLRGLAYSPDHKIIASGSLKGTIRLWDAETGQELRVLSGHTGAAASLAFSPDGKTLASGSWDRSIRLWEVASGKEIRRMDGHEAGVVSIAFSPDGKKLLSGSSDRTARLWDAENGQELVQLQGHEGEVNSAAFSHDGKLVATGSTDKTARLWEAATGKEQRKFEGHGSRVQGVAFSPDGKRLLSGSWDTTARLWDVESGKQLVSLKCTSGLGSVAFSPDGKAIAATCGWDDMIRVWDLKGDSGQIRWSGKIRHPFAVVFSKDGKKVAASGWDSLVHVWDAASGKESEASQPAGHTGWVHSVSFLADGKTLVSASDDGTVIAWDTVRGKPLRQGQAPLPRAWCLAVAPDGKTLAIGCHDQTVQLWDANTFKPISSFKTKGSVRGVAFSPDGRHLAAVSGEETEGNSTKPIPGDGAGIWEVATGQPLVRLEGHAGAVKAVAYSSDGKTIATGGADKTARLWDASTGKELRLFEGAANPVESVVFSPDGKRLAAGARGGTVRVWTLATENPPMAINTANNFLLGVVFSADGRLLATTTRGNGQVKAAVRMWDAATGKERARFPGHQETAAALAFSPNGRVLATGGGDGTVLLWDITGRTENGRFTTVELTPPSLESEWTDLGGEDGFKIHKSIWTLAAAPKQSLPLIREFLKPVAAGDAKQIAQLVKNIDSDDFEVREKASAELERIGAPAEAALRKALEGMPSAELRMRANHLLDKLAGKLQSPEDMRRQRALEVLEHVGGAESRAILEEVAKGAPEAALTQDAKAILKRLGK
jgi:RNA polymerase sigma factor (sigma-70 family)